MSNLTTASFTPTIVICVKSADFNAGVAPIPYTIAAISNPGTRVKRGCYHSKGPTNPSSCTNPKTAFTIGTLNGAPCDILIEVVEPDGADSYLPVGINFNNMTLVDFPAANVTLCGTLLKFTDLCLTPVADFEFSLLVQNSSGKLFTIDPGISHDTSFGTF